MKRKNIKIGLLFLGIVLLMNVLVGYIYKDKFFKLSFGFYGNINNSLQSEDDIFILGSSRANNHYVPKIISDSLGISCYNAGFGGYSLFLNYAILKERISNDVPSLVILDVSPNTVILAEKSYSKLDKLLPYYYKYPSFKEIIELNPKFSKVELISSLYRYNSTLYDLLKNESYEANSNKGFQPRPGNLNVETFQPFLLQDDEHLDPNKEFYLEKIIDLCKTSQVELIGVISPTYLKFDVNNRIVTKMKAIFDKHQIDMLDYSDEPEFYQKATYFEDQLHLNGAAAEKFTNKFIHQLKDKIKR